ncbi:MAG: lysophospholipase [Euzebya sp.]
MAHTTDQFLAAGGTTIFTQTWIPPHPTAVVVLSHGFGEHSGRYAHVAQALNSASYAVAALDHRGHGRSGGKRALLTDISQLGADLAMFRDEVAKHHDLPQVLLGHSMGGAVVIDHLVGDHAPVSAVVLSAPYLRNAAPIPELLKKLAPIIGRFFPSAPTQKLDADLVSRDPAVVKAYEDDPLVFHGAIPAGTGAALLALEHELLPRMGQITEQTLILHGVDDQLAAVSASREAAAAMGSQVELKTYEGMYHEIFNESEQEQVLADLVGWLKDTL